MKLGTYMHDIMTYLLKVIWGQIRSRDLGGHLGFVVNTGKNTFFVVILLCKSIFSFFHNRWCSII